MDASESDIYDYDRSSFFRLLQSAKHRPKYEFVQQQLGLVVCPLKAKVGGRAARQAEALIESHLFVPSPFYKNVYIPLASLSALASLRQPPLLALPLDHSQHIALVLRDNSGELVLFNNRRRICRNVKLLSVQTAYTDANKAYKILIVNKELSFRAPPSQPLSPAIEEPSQQPAQPAFDPPSRAPSEHQAGLDIMQEVSFASVSDVRTFGQSVDFMHSSNFADEDDETEERPGAKRAARASSDEASRSLIGEELIGEVELMRKTCIVLSTHLADCEAQLERVYVKYVNKFVGAARAQLGADSSAYSSVDLMVAVACESTIVGVLFSKLWPCLLQFNASEDAAIQAKCDRIRKLLKLGQSSRPSAETVGLCARFFNLSSEYFLINTQPVLREFKRLSLLNNPFERLECIKTSVELLTNELTLLHSSQDAASTVITSEVLIPLLAFILISSDIGCFKSVCYFIDRFQFSARPNSHSSSHVSARLDELAFFMTSFKAAVQFIETSY